MRVSVVIPALNEAASIGLVVGDLLRQPVEQVIVVDNGSTDRTAAAARSAGAEVVGEPRRGYGYACAAGSAWAAAAGADIIVTIDGDYSSLPAELPRLLEPLVRGRADLVLGSRTLGEVEPGAMPPHQRFGNWLTARLMNRLYGLKITDLGPYRAIHTALFLALNMGEMTYGWPTEMMVKAARLEARIVEVPVSWRRRRGGRSKIGGTVSGSILAAATILRVTLRHARWSPSPRG